MTKAATLLDNLRVPGGCSRAFTLTEIAIVLGVVGIMLGAIWAAASQVYHNLKVERAQQQIVSIVQNVRALYASRSTFAGSFGTIITDPMVQAGVYPGDMLVGTNPPVPYSPWDTPEAIAIFSDSSGGPTDAFLISPDYNGSAIVPLPAGACASLLGRMVGPGMDSGLIGIETDKTGWIGGSPYAGFNTISQTDATTFTGCTEMILNYRLKG